MKLRNASRSMNELAGSTAVLGLLESEIADLKEMNAMLKRRLEEAEMDAELQVRADQLLAISLPTET